MTTNATMRAVVLREPEEAAAVRERVRAAGIEAEEAEGGLLVRDPWEIAALFVTPDALRT